MLLEIHVGTGDIPGRMDFIRENFPYGANDRIAGFDFVKNVVRIHLEEKPDYEQSAWLLHQREVDEIITSFDFTDYTPQPSLIDEILATPVHQVPSNGNTRFYMEPEADKRWDRRHHLIDMNGDSGPMSSFLSLAEFSSGIESSSVQHINLSYNEVDELLAILLQWRVGHEDKRIEDTKPENALGDLDAHPF